MEIYFEYSVGFGLIFWTNSKEFSQKKSQPEWKDSNKCMCCRQYISMLLWTFGLKEDFVKGEALLLPIFAPP